MHIRFTSTKRDSKLRTAVMRHSTHVLSCALQSGSRQQIYFRFAPKFFRTENRRSPSWNSI